MPLKLWLMRHGQTEINTGCWSAQPNATRLTPLGKEQVKKSAAKLPHQPNLLITSPLLRAKETADILLKQWPETHCQTWSIQELVYLSPHRLQSLNPERRKEAVQHYWESNDPYYKDGSDAESFVTFLHRVASFHQEIMKQNGFVLVIGHGLFFKAYQLALMHGFTLNTEWMRLFRQEETVNPIKNGALLKIID